MNKLLVIGGSAGSISVIRTILNNLPEPLPFSVIIVVHQKEQCSFNLADTLSSSTKYPVINPQDNMQILPGYIYVAPAMYHTQVEPDNTISFAIDDRIKFSRPSIDILFQTAAWTYQTNLLGIILSGSSSDGVNGAKAIHKYGGTIIVQDIDEAEAKTMPKATKNALNLQQTYTKEQLCMIINQWGN